MPSNPFREREKLREAAETDRRKEQRAEEHEGIERYYWRKQAAIAKTQLRAARRLNCITAIAASLALLSVLGLIVTIWLTIDQMHIDQRAWVAPTDFLFLKTATGEVFPGVNLRNTGKTFSLKTSAWLNYAFDLGKIPVADDPNSVTNAGILGPGGTWSITLAANPLSPSIVPEIQSGHPIYVYGTVWYSDIFNTRRHWTQFCEYLETDLVTFHPCPGGVHSRTD